MKKGFGLIFMVLMAVSACRTNSIKSDDEINCKTLTPITSPDSAVNTHIKCGDENSFEASCDFSADPLEVKTGFIFPKKLFWKKNGTNEGVEYESLDGSGFVVCKRSEKSRCSPINYCQAKKTVWTGQKWVTEYSKNLHIEQFCEFDRPNLRLEKDLGIELWLLNGDKSDNDWVTSQPYVVVNLYTYKLTHVVATGKAPLAFPSIGFSHRLTPNGKSMVQVSCFKK
jgi:hypothetical protein